MYLEVEFDEGTGILNFMSEGMYLKYEIVKSILKGG